MGRLGVRNLLWIAAFYLGLGLSPLAMAVGNGKQAPATTTAAPAPATATPAPGASKIASVTVTPNPATAIIGTKVQFTATVSGTGSVKDGVTWSLAGPAGSSLSPGSIGKTGLYITPYPAPASVTVTATSTQDPTKSGTVIVTLAAPAAADGPALSVDAANRTRAIDPDIYGMNDYTLAVLVARDTDLPVERWGGDNTSRYNYLLDTTNTGADWFFENTPGSSTGYPDTSQFNAQVAQDLTTGTKTFATVPLIGWTATRKAACSYSVAKYGAQKETDPHHPDCGNGVLPNGKKLTGDPAMTSTAIDPSFVAGWVKYLVGKFGNAASGGVAIYDLDNEPEWWDSTHRDIHPAPFTYDELTNASQTYAKAVKDNDATAKVSGPVISFWMDYFYSKKDVETGWDTAPCFCANGNPVDRLAHGDVPFIEYYLRHFKKYEDANGVRLLDYLDLHTYFAADDLGLSVAGDTAAQEARLNSTRVFWDPAYTDRAYTDPDNRTKSAKPFPPQVIPLAHSWIAKDYPGTKVAITEYNWGGLEHINGAVAQADILGIFGREGLDLATLWGPPDPKTQVPGLMAFKIYRNYDGDHSKFGDMELASTSADQSQLSVYGALRTSDGRITVVVLNKTYSDLSATLSLANLTPRGKAKAFRYSNANLSAIVRLRRVKITRPAKGSTTSFLRAQFPAQSITLFVVRKKR